MYIHIYIYIEREREREREISEIIRNEHYILEPLAKKPVQDYVEQLLLLADLPLKAETSEILLILGGALPRLR